MTHQKQCSIIVVPRDKFSTTESCLETLFKITTERDEVSEVILILGGAPKEIRDRLKKRFSEKVRFIIEDRFLNPSESRNIGLRNCKTPLAILMDNDVYVRPDWLGALLGCQRETNSAMVVPIMLETEDLIHTAGNDFYVTYKNGEAHAHKELRYHGLSFWDSSNLKRQATDYGELHCQLVVVETALKLGAYDENIHEVAECDSGLTWQKAGLPMYFEPKSVIFYKLNSPVRAEDIEYFRWRWDMRLIKNGYDYFKSKWNIDMGESGMFREFLLRYNRKLSYLPRMVPTAPAIYLDTCLKTAAALFRVILLSPVSLWRRFNAWRLGYYEWPGVKKVANQKIANR